ncbi:hypothetical protein PHLCEN_2v7910 [Hermanssonia centrifuga]|uniref:Beta-glucuronidase C-terminal domain-containing protein n=1 Tax=Hermanssonia centrifuga TaxID=98765 RepID=A0A2R6NVC6_9APHY|nr:hypothetical protein PHLCEN_2v7910 [Hermanssonia centrifuga]
MSIMRDRAGRVNIRVGGNTQETAVLVDSLPDGAMIEKDKADTSNPTQTPTLIFTPEFIYLFSNVSSLVNTKWYLGIPMNDTSALRLGIAEVAEAILGDNLIGFQLGNEPDLYAGHGHRSLSYGPEDYFGEFAVVVQAIANDSNIPIRNNLIAPSPSGTHWSPEMVWDTGFITAYQPQLGALSVEHYPMDNCAEAFPDSGFGPIINPQDVFASYLTHASGIDIVQPYLNTANIAQQVGKPFLMFETNTASCGGFAGLSDSFGAALWALDYGLQMAYTPPTNQSTTKQWTVGPVFYAAVAVAETLGRSNTSQILDIQANGNNMYTPGYAVYDGGNLDRVALFNYMTDPSGANDYTASISVTGGDTPAQVSVKSVPHITALQQWLIMDLIDTFWHRRSPRNSILHGLVRFVTSLPRYRINYLMPLLISVSDTWWPVRVRSVAPYPVVDRRELTVM